MIFRRSFRNGAGGHGKQFAIRVCFALIWLELIWSSSDIMSESSSSAHVRTARTAGSRGVVMEIRGAYEAVGLCTWGLAK